MKKYKRLRLILGDQLNARHSWYESQDEETLYLIAELRQETDYVKHHVQKISAFFSAMQNFANDLQQAGHHVLHLNLDASSEYSNLEELLQWCVSHYQCEVVEYQRPDEYRLVQQMDKMVFEPAIELRCVDTEHFILPFEEISQYFKPAKANRMESFYRKMRKRFAILMDGDKPLGQKWNFDEQNRKAFKQTDLEEIPVPLVFANDVRPILQRIQAHEVRTFGEPCEQLPWPVNRQQSRQLLEYFCTHCLPRFGTFQDAMTMQSPHAWSLYHSRLSFSLNTKLLSPMEVINTAINAFQQADGKIELAQIEGFVRQILGWREYVRGMYWSNMPGYASVNVLAASNSLPAWFWTGETRMQCLQESIKQSLETSFAHHIQRLMVTGNFALLAGLDPAQVDAWYLGIYLDAIEWVELPNTRSMALFADGGWIASKPYAASGNYINKMSDYCKTCHYSVKDRTGENACPMNSLYWNFIDRNMQHFRNNPRMAFPVRQWLKRAEEEKAMLSNKASSIMENLDAL